MPRIAVIGGLIVAVLCWGLAPVAMRHLVTEITPMQMVAVRLAIASVLFLPILLQIRAVGWTRRDLLLAALLGLVGMDGYYIPVTFGAQWISSGLIGLLSATGPIMIILLSVLFLKERPSRGLFLGLGLSLVGLVILLGPSALQPALQSASQPTLQPIAQSSGTLIGVGLVLLSVLMWSIYCVAMKPLSLKYGVLPFTSVNTLASALLPTLFMGDGLAENLSQLDPIGWLALLLLAIGSTVMATLLWNLGVSHLGASQAGLFLYVIPLASVLGGYLFLGETIGLDVVLGGLMILAGVAIAQLR
ncbi:MAG TPA: DMT family transporter [Chroococcidiopsis sp.]